MQTVSIQNFLLFLRSYCQNRHFSAAPFLVHVIICQIWLNHYFMLRYEPFNVFFICYYGWFYNLCSFDNLNKVNCGSNTEKFFSKDINDHEMLFISRIVLSPTVIHRFFVFDRILCEWNWLFNVFWCIRNDTASSAIEIE